VPPIFLLDGAFIVLIAVVVVMITMRIVAVDMFTKTTLLTAALLTLVCECATRQTTSV
jgi:hypothetical protein